jgi:hypothetical protein
MAPLEYTQGFDCLWLGSDEQGSLAVFMNAGRAPIPKVALTPAYLDEVDDLLAALRPRTTANILVKNRLTESFADLASLGFYVYDWQDAPGGGAAQPGGYDLVATPGEPITMNEVPANLKAAAPAALSFPLSFRDTPQLDPRAHHDCAEPAR